MGAPRRHRKRVQRARHSARIVAARMTDETDASRRLAACDCPAVISTSGDGVVVEHYHRPDCEQLARIKRGES